MKTSAAGRWMSYRAEEFCFESTVWRHSGRAEDLPQVDDGWAQNHFNNVALRPQKVMAAYYVVFHLPTPLCIMSHNVIEIGLPFDNGIPGMSLSSATGEVVSPERKPGQNDTFEPNPITGSSLVDITRSIGQNGNQLKNKRQNRKLLQFRTLKQLGKLHLLVRELHSLKIDACGLSEVRWTGEGYFTYKESTIIYSRGKGGQRGVAVILMKSMKDSLISYNAISDRILVVKLHTKPQPTAIIQVHTGLTLNHNISDHEDFYEKLQATIESVKSHEACMVMGDFNAKVGEGGDQDHGVGPYGLDE